MSTQLATKMKDHIAGTFWGGDDKGTMIQITAVNGPYLQFTLSESAALVNTLSEFITCECERRQGLLKQQIEDLKMDSKTVFAEIANLPRSLLEVPTISVQMVEQFCPKSFEKEVAA